MHGRFIVLEGPDGSGTTTHAQLLCDRARAAGKDVFQTCEPTSGPIGAFIRQQLKDGTMPLEALQILFTADRAWHVEKEIKPALKQGKTVICERFWLSTLLYAQATDVPHQSLEFMNKNFIQPDIQIVLLPSFETCLERLGKRPERDMLEQDSIQRRVYDLYVRAAKEHDLIVIDSSGEKEEVASRIADASGI